MTAAYQLSVAFAFGLGIGFINSIPFGPINISIIDTSFKRGFIQAFMIGLGALIVDILYCAIGIFGISMLHDLFLEVFQPFGMPVLLFLGIRLAVLSRRSNPFALDHPHTVKELTKNFVSGFLMYLTNPLAIGFWILTAGIIFSHGLVHRSMSDKVSFMAGMAIGTGLWFFSLAKIVAWRRKGLAESTVRKITLVTGLLLIAFGLYLGYEYLSKLWT